MSEWWTYSLQDFLLFSPHTYYRMLELHNAAWWPAQIAALGLGLGIVLLLRGGRDRAAALVLAGIWLWVGWSFHLERYAVINWAAPWFAGLFAAQAALLLALAGRLRFSFGWRRPGTLLFGAALLLFPAVAPLAGRDWGQAEFFALAPDPTAVATLGIVLLSRRRARWLLVPFPVLWCLIGGATLWAMDAPDAWLAPVLAALAVLGLLRMGWGIMR